MDAALKFLGTYKSILLVATLMFFTACSDDKPDDVLDIKYSFNAIADPSDAGSVIPSTGSYNEGSTISVKAIPNVDYAFTGWTGTLTKDENPLTITMVKDVSLIAHFKLREYPLSLEIEGNGSVKETVVSTRTEYSIGTIVELLAVPDEGWEFVSWEGGLETAENPIRITIESEVALKAVFAESDYGIKYTETDYVSPQQMFERLGLGIALAAGFESVSGGYPKENFYGNGIVTQESFNKFKAAGIKTARIPVAWVSAVGPAPNYIIDDNYLNRIAEVVGYAEKAGMNAIININTDEIFEWLDIRRALYDEDFNQRAKDQLSAMWQQIGKKFKDKGEFLIFEAFNELSALSSIEFERDDYPDQLKKEQRAFEVYADWCQVFVNAVRSSGGCNRSRWLSIPSMAASSEVGLVRVDFPKDYVSNNRFIFTFHLYHPDDFTDGLIGEWGHTASVHSDLTLKFNEDYVEDLFLRMKEKYIDSGIPVYIGEFACQNKNRENYIKFHLYYYEFVCKAAKSCYINIMLWEDGLIGTDRVGVFDRATGEYIEYGDRIMEVLNRAVYNNDLDYTLQTVYDNAPISESIDNTPIEIPDTHFKAYLLDNFDINGDGILSVNEAESVLRINVNTVNISSLEGLKYFKYLTYLRCDCPSDDNNPDARGLLKSIDISNNVYLEEFICNDNQIEEIDFSHNKRLSTIELINNYIKSIDLSNLKYLYSLDISNNPLNALDLTACSRMHWLQVNNTNLSELDIKNMSELKILSINNTNIKSIDLNSCHELEFLSHGGEIVGNIDIDYSQLPYLKELVVYDREKSYLDVSESVNLESLVCSSSRITSIDVSNNKNLRKLNLESDFELKEIWVKEGQQIDIIKEDQAVIKYK